MTVEEMMIESLVVADVGEILGTVADRMAEKEIGALPILETIS